MFLGSQISGGTPKFLTKFYKSGSPSNMCQSLVTIGQATLGLGGEKKKTKDLNYSSKIEWLAAR